MNHGHRYYSIQYTTRMPLMNVNRLKGNAKKTIPKFFLHFPTFANNTPDTYTGTPLLKNFTG